MWGEARRVGEWGTDGNATSAEGCRVIGPGRLLELSVRAHRLHFMP
jgi:hypothetical protein